MVALLCQFSNGRCGCVRNASGRVEMVAIPSGVPPENSVLVLGRVTTTAWADSTHSTGTGFVGAVRASERGWQVACRVSFTGVLRTDASLMLENAILIITAQRVIDRSVYIVEGPPAVLLSIEKLAGALG